MIPLRFLFLYLLIELFPGISISQEFYIVAPGLKKVSLMNGNCSSGNVSPCSNSSGFSISMYKDTLYTIDMSRNLRRSVIVNNVETACKIIATLSLQYNSLTVDSAGMLYGAHYNTLSRIDPRSGKETILGTLPYPSAGDMIFYQGDLYLAADIPSAGIVKINIDTPRLSKMYIPFQNRQVYGLVNIAVECNKNKVVAVEWTGTNSNLIELDMVNKRIVGSICTLPYLVYDAASSVETGRVANIVIEEIKQIPQCSNKPLSGGLNIKCSSGVSTYTYTLNNTLSNTTGLFTGLAAGNYAIHISSALGCVRDTFASVQQADTSKFQLEVIHSICNAKSGSITINTSSTALPFLYSLNNSSLQVTNSFTGLSKGDYYVQVADNNNCFSSTIVTVISTTPKLDQTINIYPATCGVNNGKILISTSTPVTGYSLNNNPQQSSGVFTNLDSGYYMVSTFTAPGCRYDSLVHITKVNVSTPLVSLVTTSPTCYNTSDGSFTINLKGLFPPYFISLNGGSYSNKFNYTKLNSSTYNIKIRDAQNCIFDTVAVIPVYVNRPPAYSINSGNPTCFQPLSGSIKFNITGNAAPYTIQRAKQLYASSYQFKNLSSGIHIFEIFDKNHCLVDSINYFLDVVRTGLCDTIIVPNAFTPNNDRTNDQFMVKAYGMLTDYFLSVYNRYGQLVFSTTDISAGWDGKYHQTDQPSGTFIWLIHYTLPDGRKRNGKGTVILSR
jgi:gliding motility-associated-like protein